VAVLPRAFANGQVRPTAAQPLVTFPVPADARTGDLLLLWVGFQFSYNSVIHYNGTYGGVITPSGWTRILLVEQFNNADPGIALYCFRRFLAAGEVSFQFTTFGRQAPTFGDAPILYSMGAYAGVDVTTPIEAFASAQITPESPSSAAPSVTTTLVDCRLVCAWVGPRDPDLFPIPTWTAPGGMAVRANLNVNASPEPGGNLLVADENLAAAAASGTRVATVSSTVESVAASVALRQDQSEPTAQARSFRIGLRFGIPYIRQEAARTALDDILENPDDSTVRVVALIRRRDLGLGAELSEYLAQNMPDPGDRPPGMLARMVESFTVTRSIAASERMGGPGSVSLGGLTLASGDGAIDFYADSAIDQREAEFSIGGKSPRGEELPWGLYQKFLVLKGDNIAPGVDRTQLMLGDGGDVLDRNVQLNTYLGTGGMEGGADLKGVVKPFGIGKVENAELRLLSTVPYILQFHDGAGCGAARAFYTLWDSGAAPVPQDLYTVDLAAGTIELNTNPAGRLTCDFLGPADAGDTAATFFRWLTSDYGIGPLAFPTDFVVDYFVAFAAASTAHLGLFVRENATINSLLPRVMAPLGYWIRSRQGRMLVGKVAPPQGTPNLQLGTKVRIRRLTPRPLVKPNCRISIGWRPNWTKQDAGEIAGYYRTTERAVFAGETYRVIQFPDAGSAGRDPDVLVAFPSSKELEMIETLFVDEDDANAAAEEAWAIYGVPRRFWEAEIDLSGIRTDVGRVEELTHPRFGLNSGRSVMTMEITDTIRGCRLLLFSTPGAPLLSLEEGGTLRTEDDKGIEL